MRASRRFAAFAVLAPFISGTPLPAAPPALRLPAGPLLIEGSVEVREKAGDDSSARSYRAAILLLPRAPAKEGANGGGKGWIAIRLLTPAAEGERPLAAMDEVEEKVTGSGAALEPIGETPMELEEASLALRGTLPLDVLPPLPLPATSEGRAQVEIPVLGLALVRLPLAVKVEPSGEGTRVHVELAPGARPEFTYGEGKGVVTAWSRSDRLSTSGSPQSIAETVAVAIEEGDSKTSAERRLSLEAASVSGAAGEAEALARELEEVSKLFSGLKPSKEIQARIERLEASKGGRMAEIAAKALSARVADYIALFEKDEDAKKLAALIGKPAPDFALEDLEGRKTSFRELARGKAILLSFWGYG
jgi:hypothetical protein